ncbi:DUF7768 domain-containing protein [Anaerotruncus rubiinfantis]|uniref:DUF7768 domain-containing protein n=1 Tax=Anaerotruncus rubiinfantis TaxID=1720200 RepID=UPI00082E4278|nr:hypothetical protein [Anaerotruncus rubiinfantis]
MKLVYIASPFAGDAEENVQKSRVYCLVALESGVTPIAKGLDIPVHHIAVAPEQDITLAL